MGIFDSFKSKAGDLMDKAGDIAGDLTDKAKDQAGDLTGKAKDQTGGRFGSQIDQGVDVAKQRMGNADEAMRAEADQQS
jgi:hypothetical protein